VRGVKIQSAITTPRSRVARGQVLLKLLLHRLKFIFTRYSSSAYLLIIKVCHLLLLLRHLGTPREATFKCGLSDTVYSFITHAQGCAGFLHEIRVANEGPEQEGGIVLPSDEETLHALLLLGSNPQ